MAQGNDAGELRALREKIDAIDEELQRLISQRAELAVAVARAKQAAGDAQFYRPEREAAVLKQVLARNAGPLRNEEMARLFREIMSACLALESPLRIAYLGPEGTFTQQAALKHFGHSVRTASLGSIDEVFRDVESGAAHFGVVPIENSTEGVVNHTLDRFMSSPLQICGEVDLRIHQHLMRKVGGLEGITRIVSHQQSLAQCREWLDAHMPKVERVAVASNAEAARQAAQDPKLAAVGGSSAAEIYGLELLAANIEDNPDNITRFLVIGMLAAGRTGDDKTSLLISGRNRSGSLAQLLGPLAKYKINMTRIESRPSRTALWEYVFFIDIDGHVQDPHLKQALGELEAEAAFVKLLGSYPKAVL